MFSILVARRQLVAGLRRCFRHHGGDGLCLGATVEFAAAVQRGLARAPQLDAQDAGFVAAQEEAARAGQLPDPALTFGQSPTIR